jgi:hypothetical protein
MSKPIRIPKSNGPPYPTLPCGCGILVGVPSEHNCPVTARLAVIRELREWARTNLIATDINMYDALLAKLDEMEGA